MDPRGRREYTYAIRGSRQDLQTFRAIPARSWADFVAFTRRSAGVIRFVVALFTRIVLPLFRPYRDRRLAPFLIQILDSLWRCNERFL